MSWSQDPSVQIFRAYDHGFDPDPAYCLWIAHIGNRYIAFKEKLWKRTVIPDIAKDILAESEGMRVVVTYNDPVMDLKTGNVHTMKDQFELLGIPMENSVNNREHYASAIATALTTEVEPGVPKLQILAPGSGPGLGCPYLIKTLPQQQYDPKHPMRMANHKHDHAAVALAYFLISESSMDRSSGPNGKPVPKWMKPKAGKNERLILGKENVKD
jgi:hypothetical protein